MQDDQSRRQTPLNGWKEIAAHLGKSVRSVQRWEATLGLPVRRIRTPDGQIVYAERDEIDEWRRRLDAAPTPEPEDPLDPESIPEPPEISTPPPETVRPRTIPILLMVAAAVGLFAAGTLTGSWLARPSPVVVSVVFAGRSLQGLNRQGAVVWSYRFDHDVSQPASSVPDPLHVDIDGDGIAEWLVPVRFSMPGTLTGTSDAVFLLAHDGTVKWSVQPDQNLTYPNRTTSAPWRITDYAVSPAAPRRMWASFAHHTGASSFILEIGVNGASALRYFQYGTIYSVAHWMTPAGGFLAAGGVSVEHGQASLALMPENGPPASMPAENLRRASCAECPSDGPTRLFLFPRSELTTAAHELYPYVVNLSTVGPALEVMTYQGQGHALFMVDPDFSVESWQMMQTYWGAHKQLELSGRLDHAAEECPDRASPKLVREWMPALGWRQAEVPPGPGGRGLQTASNSGSRTDDAATTAP